MERGNDWTVRRAREVGKRVAYFRLLAKDDRGRPLTVQGLSDRCAKAGLELSRPTLSKLEKGFRQSVTVDEVTVIAHALGVAPNMLLFPLGQADVTEVLPGSALEPFAAMQWFAGEAELVTGPDGKLAAGPTDDGGDYGLFRTHQRLVFHLVRRMEALTAGTPGPTFAVLLRPDMPSPAPEDVPLRELNDLALYLQQVRASIRERGLKPPPLPAELAGLESQAGADG